jgi:hypothetical protein
MKKKLFAMFLVLAMVMTFIPMTALAAGVPDLPTPKVEVKGSNVTITVDGNSVTYDKAFVKNTVATFAFDQYDITVEFNGNGFKSVKSIVVRNPQGDNLPNNSGSQGGNVGNVFLNPAADPSVYINKDYNNAQFHCNAINGNGRVWTTLGKDTTQKWNAPLVFVKVDGDQPVSVQANQDTAWELFDKTTFVCEVCGSKEWITFSNNSGKPDGKNIQMNHPGEDVTIIKVWQDAKGNVIPAGNLSVSFTVTLSSGKTYKLGTGKYFLPSDLTATVVEGKTPANYSLVQVKVDGKGKVVGLEAADVTMGDKVTFTNKEDSYAWILKEWADDNPGGLVALFDIYLYDGDNDPTFYGERVAANVKAEEKVYVAPGQYVVAEQVKEGYQKLDDQIIVVGKDEIGVCTFVNEPDGGEKGSIRFEKKVEGENIVTWLTGRYNDNDKVMAIISGLEFYLTDKNGIEAGREHPDFMTGLVTFAQLVPGEYVLSEEITGAAVGIFKGMADIEGITIADGDNKFYVLGGTVRGNIDGGDIRNGDLFKIVNGYGSGLFNWGYGPEGIGYDGLNGSGHIFYIGVDSVRTGERFASYCANAGSTNFEEQGNYMVANSLNEEKWLQAFNYIVDNYGDLNENRVITQVITWELLGDISIDGLEATRLTDAEKAAIRDVYENYEGYVGSGTVVDVVYMICDNAEHNAVSCQPQIVPIFGTFYVENEPENGGEEGGVSFSKTKYGVPTSGFDFELFKLNEVTG